MFYNVQFNAFCIIFKNKSICHKCFSEANPILKDFKIQNVDAFAVYPYDEFIKSQLYQFKGCFDIELAPIFLDYYKTYLRFHYFNYVIVPAPSAFEADKERGFNHVVEMFKVLGLEIVPCIKKTANIKQSSLHAEERKNIKDYLSFNNEYNITNKNILIVDDVLTTGSTLNAIINLIKKHHPKKIQVLVMSMVVPK